MTRPWSNPADNQADRRAEVARWYRLALLRADPTACAVLDGIVADFGQDGWLIPQVASDELLVTRKEAARRAGVDPDTITQWVLRDLINRYPGGYSWPEIDKMLAERRLKRKRQSAARAAELDQ